MIEHCPTCGTPLQLFQTAYGHKTAMCFTCDERGRPDTEVWFKTWCPDCMSVNWFEDNDDLAVSAAECHKCKRRYWVDEEFSRGYQEREGNYGEGTDHETLSSFLAVATAYVGQPHPL